VVSVFVVAEVVALTRDTSEGLKGTTQRLVPADAPEQIARCAGEIRQSGGMSGALRAPEKASKRGLPSAIAARTYGLTLYRDTLPRTQVVRRLAFAGTFWHGKGMKKSRRREFSVIVHRDEEGFYVASVPALRGCHTQARSLDKLMQRIREAIELCLLLSC
jgi:hypothetical protein